MSYDNYKELALDLTLDVKDAHKRISSLERALQKANKQLFQLRGGYVPASEDGETWCPKCGEEITEESWEFCPKCGVHFLWELPEPDDDYGRVKEARLYGAC